MNSTKKRFIVLLLGFIGLCTYSCRAQHLEISGDTIFVNAETEVRIQFPSIPSTFYTAPTNAPYNFKTIGKGFTVIAKMSNTKPATLFVAEGKRNHRFIIAFRKKIDYTNPDEIYYDYSSKKKLKRHIKKTDHH